MTKQPGKVDFGAVLKIAETLPDVAQSVSARGIALKVSGKMFACTATNKSAEPDSLMVNVGFEEREALIAAHPATYYLTDHYRGYPVVLVRLPTIGADALRDLLEDAAALAKQPAKRKKEPTD